MHLITGILHEQHLKEQGIIELETNDQKELGRNSKTPKPLETTYYQWLKTAAVKIGWANGNSSQRRELLKLSARAVYSEGAKASDVRVRLPNWRLLLRHVKVVVVFRGFML
jgi:hypothetical protein